MSPRLGQHIPQPKAVRKADVLAGVASRPLRCEWKSGMVEEWNGGKVERLGTTPLLHHSLPHQWGQTLRRYPNTLNFTGKPSLLAENLILHNALAVCTTR